MAQAPKKLLEQMHDALRLKHYALRTETTSLAWARRSILFHGKRHPATLGTDRHPKGMFTPAPREGAHWSRPAPPAGGHVSPGVFTPTPCAGRSTHRSALGKGLGRRSAATSGAKYAPQDGVRILPRAMRRILPMTEVCWRFACRPPNTQRPTYRTELARLGQLRQV